MRLRLLLFLVLLVNPASALAQSDFQSFWANFRSAVQKNDKAAVKGMMAPRFEWALDGAVARNEAFSYIDKKDWLDLKKAVGRKTYTCKAISENYSGYCAKSGPRARYDWMFANIGGTWKFYALRGH
jgi:hypothetical protein